MHNVYSYLYLPSLWLNSGTTLQSLYLHLECQASSWVCAPQHHQNNVKSIVIITLQHNSQLFCCRMKLLRAAFNHAEYEGHLILISSVILDVIFQLFHTEALYFVLTTSYIPLTKGILSRSSWTFTILQLHKIIFLLHLPRTPVRY